MGKRGRPKKAVKYTRTINIRLTPGQWLTAAEFSGGRAFIEPSVFIRKALLNKIEKK